MARAAVLLALALLGSGCGVFTRPVDVYMRAGWMVANWNEPRAFPPRANVCMEEFCRRTDTARKYVGGRKGYTSQVHYRYCPEHSPHFVATGSRFDGFFYFVYWGSAFIAAFGYVALILFLPVFGVASLIGKARGREVDIEGPATVVTFVAFAINVAAWLMFAIW